MKSTAVRYTLPAIGLHWLLAILITGTFLVGLYIDYLPLSPRKLQLYSWHKWSGITVLWLAVLRFAWRLNHRPPELSASMPAWQRSMAAALHHLLYVLMFLVPLSGWMMSSAKGFPVHYFGIWPLPDLISKNKEMAERLELAHVLLNYTLAALVVGHAAAAIRHHFWDRDDVLVRMLPFLKQRQPAVKPGVNSSHDEHNKLKGE